MKTKKTNASRILDNMKIAYRLLEYEVDENNLDAVHVANSVGMPSAQVFKTLCVQGDKTGVIFACIPGNHELDLKALAKISGNKRAELVALKDVLPLTGYIRGGVSPLAICAARMASSSSLLQKQRNAWSFSMSCSACFL